MALRHDLRRGALCMLAAHALFTAMGVIVKHLADHIPVIELMFFRSAFALPVILAICARSGGASLRTRRFPGHALRASTGIAAQTLGFYALSVLPLAEQTALGYTQRDGGDPNEIAIDPVDGRGQDILFLRVPEAKTIKNRLHLDLRPDDQDAEVARLLALGATRADIGQGQQTWVVLADPEGNEFCVLRVLTPQEQAAREEQEQH